ncbi:MAG: hypothetical protein LPK47_04550 [Bacteroidota bacterium]|nr:hypothetical protein [Bacteroidota bacterium]
MKNTTLLLFSFLSISLAHGQTHALTDEGQDVLLFEDGTWSYVEDLELTENEVEIPMNPTEFKRPKSASFLVKSSSFNIGIHIDPKAWSFNKGKTNEDAEYEFESKKGEIYGMMIAEGIEIPLLTLRSIALENAQSVAPDVHIVHEEYRMVNGIKVLCLQMEGTYQGIQVAYLGYYYSNENGTVQMVTYSGKKIMEREKERAVEFLNGLVEL